MLALGQPLKDGDHAKYLKMAKKKLKRLRNANELFQEIQPEISSHTNFQMAANSLNIAVAAIETIIIPPAENSPTENSPTDNSPANNP